MPILIIGCFALMARSEIICKNLDCFKSRWSQSARKIAGSGIKDVSALGLDGLAAVIESISVFMRGP